MKGMRRRSKLWLAIASSSVLAACNGDLKDTISSVQPTEQNQPSANTAPVADAGGAVIGAGNTVVFLNGSGSSDADQDELQYMWEVLSSPDGSAYSLSSNDKAVARFSSDLEGEYGLKLTVSDGQASDTSETSVFIDQDGDGVVSGQDLDRDGDLVPNTKDAFPDNPAEFVDTDGDGIGNFAQKDEDGDGVEDDIDAFPFDPSLHAPRKFVEAGFNDNPGQASVTGFAAPFSVEGAIEKALDGDYYSFSANSGQIVTVGCTTDSVSFEPVAAIADASGRTITSIQPNLGGSKWAEGTSVQVTTTGEHFLIINGSNQQGSADFSYSCDVFYDDDLDAINDDIELAIGLNPERIDSEGDGINDAAEINVAQTAGVTTPFDVDGDGVPNWFDKDSDGDMIPDAIEGYSDADDDGLGNFADVDSDANGEVDLAEAGINPLYPVDTDLDRTPDYADIDDDGDGILDTNDAQRTQKAAKTDVLDQSNPFYVSGFRAELEDGTEVEGSAIIGRDLFIKGTGFSATPEENTVVFKTSDKTLNVPATNLVDGELVVPYPLQTSSEVSVLVAGTLSNDLTADVITEKTPVLDETGLLSQSAGDYVTLTGANFAEPLSISVSGEPVTRISSIQPGEIRFQIPYGVPSGDIVVSNNAGVSNALSLKVTTFGTIGLRLPQGASLSSDNLVLSPGTEAPKEFESFTTSIQKSASAPELVSALLKDGSGSVSGTYLTGFMTPNSSSLTLSADSSAEALTIIGAGAFQKIDTGAPYQNIEVLIELIDDIPSVDAFGAEIERQLATDPMALESLNSELLTLLRKSVEDANTAIAEAINNGSLRGPAVQTSSLANPVRIFPDEQYGLEILPQIVNKEGDFNGNVTIVNDTMLPMSAEVVDKESGEILIGHIDDWYSDAIPPQDIYYIASETPLKQPKFRNADVNIIAPGALAPRAKNPEALRYLQMRAGLNGVATMFRTLLGVRENSSAFIDITLAYGSQTVISLGKHIAAGDFAGFLEGWFVALRDDCIVRGPACNLLAKNLLDFDQDDLIKLIVKQNLVVKIVKGVEGGLLLGNMVIDKNTTPQSIDFGVRWPLAVTNLSPTKIRPESTSVTVELTGYGFSGFKHYFWSDPVLPKVSITDSNAGSITLQASEVEPGRKIKVTLPASYLVNAVGPLLVSVEHRNVVASADPHQIEIDSKVEITELDRDFGKPSDVVRVIGNGFSEDLFGNSVEFTSANGGTVSAKVLTASMNRLAVLVPRGVADGPVTVTVDGKTSNPASFDVTVKAIQVSFGDNGSANDDRYGLYVNGKHIQSMKEPTRRVGPLAIDLPPGQHRASLRGIDAPDGVGTFFIEFSGVSNIDGPPLSGTDLVSGVVKAWTFTVDDQATTSAAQLDRSEPKIRWKE